MFYTMADVIRANERAGQYFFSPSTKHFFSSRIGQTLYLDAGGQGRYFITSEQFIPSSGRPMPRQYTVRMVTDDASIETVGEFQQFATSAQATAFIRRLVKRATEPTEL